MSAELNLLYRPVVLLDGLEAFVRGGPEAGTRVAPGVIIAGTERVALDAVGVAVLRLMGRGLRFTGRRRTSVSSPASPERVRHRASALCARTSIAIVAA
jgi:uncharacterized protein (DUF362 family)